MEEREKKQSHNPYKVLKFQPTQGLQIDNFDRKKMMQLSSYHYVQSKSLLINVLHTGEMTQWCGCLYFHCCWLSTCHKKTK